MGNAEVIVIDRTQQEVSLVEELTGDVNILEEPTIWDPAWCDPDVLEGINVTLDIMHRAGRSEEDMAFVIKHKETVEAMLRLQGEKPHELQEVVDDPESYQPSEPILISPTVR